MTQVTDPFATTAHAPNAPSAPIDQYERMSPYERQARAEQQAAIEAMRARQEASRGPVVWLPFGRQRPLRQYAGMNTIPLRKNPWIDKPELVLKDPEPGAHYGFATYDARTKGLFRSHQYEPVYEHELIDDNDVPYSVETVLGPVKGTLTEKGPCNLVLWHGLVMIKIPQSVWMREYEAPALESATRLTMHQQSFNEGRLGGQAVVREVNDGVPEYTHQGHEVALKRDNVVAEMAINKPLTKFPN